LYISQLRAHDLSQGEAHILAHLATSSPATIADLHAELAHKRSTLTSILDRLVARGLITRVVGTEDRRTFVITTTATGRKLATKIHDHLISLEDAVGEDVTREDIRGFLKVLNAIEQTAHEAVIGRRSNT